MKTARFFLVACVWLAAGWNGCNGMIGDLDDPIIEFGVSHYDEAAACHRDMEFVNNILSSHADPNSRDEQGDPVLQKAARWGDVAAVKSLLAAGADVNAKNRVDTSALSAAIFFKRVEVVKLLLAAKVAQATLNEELYEAASWGGAAEIVSLLLSAKAEINARGGISKDSTALQHAAFWGEDEIVRVLLDAKAEVDARDEEGSSALINAADRGHAKVVRLLLAARANLHAREYRGRTAFDVALREKREDAFKLLVVALLQECWPTLPIELSDMIAEECDCAETAHEQLAAVALRRCERRCDIVEKLSELLARCSVM